MFGLGGSGLASCSALLAGGADVIAFDDDAASVGEGQAAGIPTADLREHRLVAHRRAGAGARRAADASGAALDGGAGESRRVSRSSATSNCSAASARRARRDAPFVAITGTNGKSTTTALIAHILRSAGRDVQMGGNIGTAILSLQPPAPERVHVIEVSSYQIDLAPTLDPTVGILLNVTPDHLDRHGTMENYAAIKERAVANADVAVIAVDDDYTARRRRAAGTERAPDQPGFGGDQPRSRLLHAMEAGSCAAANASPTSPASGPCAACTMRRTRRRRWPRRSRSACRRTPSSAACLTFPGLPHRMEEVGRKGKVLFVNDSKATNADSADKALASFPGDIFWIPGGKAKEGGITSLTRFFPRIAKAYLIGEASDGFAAVLEGQVPYERLRHARCRHRNRRRRMRRLLRRRSRSCCCRRPAPPSTSTGISRSAATTSASWCEALV